MSTVSTVSRFVEAVYQARREWMRAMLPIDRVRVPRELWEELVAEDHEVSTTATVFSIPVEPVTGLAEPEVVGPEVVYQEEGLPAQTVMRRRARLPLVV